MTARAPYSDSMLSRLLPILCAAALLAPAAEARPAKATKAELAADREVVAVMQIRDRGRIEEALRAVQELVKKRPDHVAAHRLYQELAAVGRRNGRLVEAEYRHWLDAAPDEPVRRLLHASALLTTALTTPGYFDRRMARDVEGVLVAVEALAETEAWAHFIAADLEKLRGRPDRESAHVEAAYSVAPYEPSILYDLVRRRFLELKDQDAAELCLELVKTTPWRALGCSVLWEVPKSRITDELDGTQETILATLAAAEAKHKNDVVTLRALEELYATVQDRSAMRRVRARLAEVDPGWVPVVDRFPYMPPLEGGELADDEVAGLREVQAAIEETTTLQDRHDTLLRIQPSLPESPRVRAFFHGALADTYRGLGDPDASRGERRKAMEAVPDDPHLRNAWAYTCALDKVDMAEALTVIDASITDMLGARFHLLDIDIGDTLADWEAARAASAGAIIDTKGWLLYQLGRHQEAAAWLQLAALLSSDGTVQAHLGRARYALGNDEAAFMHLLRALALGGVEDEEVVRSLAGHLYAKSHVIPGGLEALIDEQRRVLGVQDLDGPEAEIAPTRAPEVEIVPEDETGLVGTSAPRLAYETLDGSLESISDFEGRVVVVDFWASWCGPCRLALPMLDSLAKAFDGEEVVFVAVSVDESMADAKSFWSDYASPMRVGLAEDGAAEAYRVNAIPVTYVIDREGNIASVKSGFESSHQEQLVAEVIELLRD